jgi:hypothetical protein
MKKKFIYPGDMLRLLLSAALLVFVTSVFGQATPGYTFIQQNSTNPYGLFVQGQTGTAGTISLEGNGGSAIFWIGVSGDNWLKIGGNGGTFPSLGAINIDGNGNIGVNTSNTSNYRFNCAGTAVFDQVTVTNFSGNNPKATPWADYVFEKTYHLLPLDSLSAFIKTKNHLPGIPTAEEVQKNGIDLGATQAKLLEKIEQLTLYTIDLQNQADQSRTENEKLLKLLQAQSEQLAAMQQKTDKMQQQLDKLTP